MTRGLNQSQDVWKLVEKGDKPIWDKYVNTQTGESSYEEITPRLIQTGDGCKHFFERIDTAGNIQCIHCTTGTRIITGVHNLVDGQVVTVIK